MQARVFRLVATAATALFALSLALACGEEDSDDGTDCPADAPANASSCSDYDAGTACTYGSTTCTCSGVSWNCMQGGGNGNNNTTGFPTGSGGNGFGPTE